jgi:serine/threonine-protein kinase
VILFEMLTGAVPFMGETAQEVMRQHVSQPVPSMRRLRPDLSIPPAAEHVMHTAMAKRPDDRYQSAAALLTAIAACFEGVRQAVSEAEKASPPRQATAALGSGRGGLSLLRR